ncbi:MAG TPA: hypothetical protein VF621_13860 [Pyrinomonadaceae bacterium]
MGWGDSFKQKWNSATDAARQKASALATGARQVGVKALEKTQAAADEAARKAAEAAAWAKQAAAKAAQAAQQKAQQAAQAVKQKAQQAAGAAQQKAQQVAQAAQQKAGQVANQTRQAAAVTAKKVRQTFVGVKKSFDEWKHTQAVAPCPRQEQVSRFLNFEAKKPTAPGQLKTGFDASAYQYKGGPRGLPVEGAAGYAGADIDGFKVGAEAGVLRAKGTFYSGNNTCNPFARADVEAKALSASAKGDILVGYDTNRYGVSVGVDAAASYASVEAKPEVNIPIPFTGWSIAARAKLSADAGPSAGAGGHAYYDKQEQRAHAGLFGKLIGGAGLDISIGKKYTGSERRADW